MVSCRKHGFISNDFVECHHIDVLKLNHFFILNKLIETMSKKEVNWRNHIIEFVTVVLGILIAFGLNSFNEKRKAKTSADLQLSRIVEEVRSNRVIIEKGLNYHRKLLANLQEKPDSTDVILKLSDPVGYAWRFAQNSDFRTYIDYETIVLLEEIYTKQDRLLNYNISVTDKMDYTNVVQPFFLAASGTPERAEAIMRHKGFEMAIRGAWIPVFYDVVFYESDLLNVYDKLLEEMGASK